MPHRWACNDKWPGSLPTCSSEPAAPCHKACISPHTYSHFIRIHSLPSASQGGQPGKYAFLQKTCGECRGEAQGCASIIYPTATTLQEVSRINCGGLAWTSTIWCRFRNLTNCYDPVGESTGLHRYF